MSARAPRVGAPSIAVSHASQHGITTQGFGPPPPAPSRKAEQLASAVSVPDFQAWQAREARAHELHAQDGLQEHFDKLEVERQALREWTKTLPLETPDSGEDAPLLGGGHLVPWLDRARAPAEKTRQEQIEADRKREVEVLDKLASNALPRELLLLVLEYAVDSRAAELELQDEHTLSLTSMELLGISIPAQKLHPLVQKMILQRSRIQLDIPFTRRTGGGEPIAQIPPFVASLPHPISNLALTCDVEIHGTRLTYPISIFRMTRGAGSLKQAFPNLERFTLLLNFSVDDTVPETALSKSCFCGYTATTTHRELVLKMLAAVYASGPGRGKMLKLGFCTIDSEKRHESASVVIEPSTNPVEYDASGEEVAAHPMRQVLLQATKIELMGQRSTGSGGAAASMPPPFYPAPAAAYRQRSNDDMVMLEDETRTVGYAGPSENPGPRQLRVTNP